MMRHAWNNYKLYAWGKNELKPMTKRAHLTSVFGGGDLGATIVDGMDTLYVMGLIDEFREGRDWIAEHFHINEIVSTLTLLNLLHSSYSIDNLMYEKTSYLHFILFWT